MCGILGALTIADSIDEKEKFKAALNIMHRRGPDGSDHVEIFFGDKEIHLGHTRLSILDLSDRSSQPYFSKSRRFCVVYNGEIYNFKEIASELKALGVEVSGESDTEVLVEAWAQWGLSSIAKFTGMFAFAVYDNSSGTVTLVRDAFGIKPLFYRSDSKGFMFASDPRALMASSVDSPTANIQSAYDYLVFGAYDHTTSTFFEEFKYLPPGGVMVIDVNHHLDTDIFKWWNPNILSNGQLSFDEAALKLRSLFLDSVRIHLRSDVPLGAALSGGLDSSAVVCAIRYLEPDMHLHTFSYIAKGTSISEEYWVDMVNQHVNAIPHKIVVNPDELIDDIDDVIKGQGEPFGGTSIYAQYRVFKAAKLAGMKVLLNGQGADELLAGYDGYPQAVMHSLLNQGRLFALFYFIKHWAKWPNRSLKNGILMLFELLTPCVFRTFLRSLLGQKSTPGYLDLSVLQAAGIEPVFKPTFAPQPEGFQRRLVEKLRNTLMGNGLAEQLRDNDRDSMRWSIESRVPFLTTEIAEFLLGLPESYLISLDGETKCIFRAAMRGIVPDEILDRRDKIGFQTPESDWLRQHPQVFREWMAHAPQISMLKPDQAIAFVDDFLNGKEDNGPKVWRLLNYVRWHHLMNIQNPATMKMTSSS